MLHEATRQLRYSLHGIGLSITAPPLILSALDARLCPLRLEQADPSNSDVLRYDFTDGFEPTVQRPPGELRSVYEAEAGEVVYSAAADRLFIAFGESIRADCNPGLGRTRVWAVDVAAEQWRLSHPLLTLSLIEQLKRRGLFSLHAAGVARQGRALLVVGTSGAGKTTLSLALVRAGFDFLSDDMLFLDPDGNPPRVHAFPDEVDITQHTAEFFPELRPLADTPRRRGFPKWTLRAEAVFGAHIAWTCQPAALIFPRISAAAASRLEPMRSSDALMEMLPNVLLTEPHACQAHLHALASLAHHTPCYRLSTGRDFEALPGLLGAILG
jgi:hypothetical protein